METNEPQEIWIQKEVWTGRELERRIAS